MKLKMNFWNQLKMLTDLIVISIIYFFIIYYLPCRDLRLVLFLLSPYFIFFFLPVLFLHLSYLSQSIGVIFIVKGSISIKKKEIEIFKYNIDQISEIIFYMNGSKGTVNGVLAFSNYYYAKIILLDNSFFIITSLYSNKIDKILEENFKEVKITTEKVFYPKIS